MQLVNFEEQLVEEREDAIVDIAHAISEVNETFRDLAAIVEEQGKNIDTIDNNTTAAQANTADGVDQLTQAEKHQKGYRKWIIVMLLLIILGAGGTGVGVWLKSEGKI
jgi:syntaxin 7